jgi:hypothetical protein
VRCTGPFSLRLQMALTICLSMVEAYDNHIGLPDT